MLCFLQYRKMVDLFPLLVSKDFVYPYCCFQNCYLYCVEHSRACLPYHVVQLFVRVDEATTPNWLIWCHQKAKDLVAVLSYWGQMSSYFYYCRQFPKNLHLPPKCYWMQKKCLLPNHHLKRLLYFKRKNNFGNKTKFELQQSFTLTDVVYFHSI